MFAGKILALLFFLVGVFAIIQITLPLAAYKLWEVRELNQDILISPEPKDHQQILGISVQDSDSFPAFISTNTHREHMYNQFSVSIPSLKIDSAKVIVDSNDLNVGLAHLPGTALPGEKGNIFISGHSALPILFKGNKDYGTIFANLEKIKKGDQILVTAPSGKFIYVVDQLKVVDPKDLSVIPPPDNMGRYISLMTCVPPGFNTKRLVVLGKLI
jgi:LPXTG-site transpeptidase (sortase) family protein